MKSLTQETKHDKLRGMKTLSLVMLGLLTATAGYSADSQPAAAQAAAPDLMSMAQDARCRQVLVTCLVNGVPMRMMLDTGATHTVLHEESAARVPQAQWIDTSKMQFTGNSTQLPKMLQAALQTAPAVSPKHVFLVMNLGAVRSMMAEKIDGILGMDMLRHLPFTFDLRENKFYWGTPQAGEPQLLHARHDGMGRVMVQGKCRGKTVQMLLDTGSSVTRVAAAEWAPGAQGDVEAKVSDIDQHSGLRMTGGKPGDIELAPGIIAKGITPLLCSPQEKPMLGMDALRNQILVHLPAENSPTGIFALMK